jgi:hypothetical protein
LSGGRSKPAQKLALLQALVHAFFRLGRAALAWLFVVMDRLDNGFFIIFSFVGNDTRSK